MALYSKKKYFNNVRWPYALFVMDMNFTDFTSLDVDQQITITNTKRLFGYVLRAAVEISNEHFFNREKVYESLAEKVKILLYAYRTDSDYEDAAKRILEDVTDDFISFLTEMKAIDILERNPTILKWLSSGVIIRYDNY